MARNGRCSFFCILSVKNDRCLAGKHIHGKFVQKRIEYRIESLKNDEKGQFV